MRKFIFLFTLLSAFWSCDKDEEEEMLPFYEYTSDAPFIEPILDWSKDSKSIRENIPEGFRLLREVNWNGISLSWIGNLESSKLIELDGDYINILYYIDKTDKVCAVELKYSTLGYETIYEDCFEYFVCLLGKPNRNDKDLDWKTSNAHICLVSVWTGYDVSIIFFNPEALILSKTAKNKAK